MIIYQVGFGLAPGIDSKSSRLLYAGQTGPVATPKGG